jgi:hypothetical protein
MGCESETPVEEVPLQIEEPVVEEVPSEPIKQNHQPHVVELGFTQDAYIYSDTIAVEYETFDPDGDSTREELFWMVNGQELISEKGRKLRRKNIKKGDEIVATLVVNDGVLENQQSIKTVVGNAPPQWLRDPRNLTKVDGYTVEAVDPDGDPLTYRLQGAPKGMSISNEGRISYEGSINEPGGSYTIRVIAEDTDNGIVQWSFSIQLSPGSGAQ